MAVGRKSVLAAHIQTHKMVNNAERTKSRLICFLSGVDGAHTYKFSYTETTTCILLQLEKFKLSALRCGTTTLMVYFIFRHPHFTTDPRAAHRHSRLMWRVNKLKSPNKHKLVVVAWKDHRRYPNSNFILYLGQWFTHNPLCCLLLRMSK